MTAQNFYQLNPDQKAQVVQEFYRHQHQNGLLKTPKKPKDQSQQLPQEQTLVPEMKSEQRKEERKIKIKEQDIKLSQSPQQGMVSDTLSKGKEIRQRTADKLKGTPNVSESPVENSSPGMQTPEVGNMSSPQPVVEDGALSEQPVPEK